jgi:dihydrofolate synthase/folylpolyglutamate synthase
MMEYSEALAYLDGSRWLGAEPSLRRIRELLSGLGDPQKELRFVHIAGTNGKGSCAAMLASVLRAAGYRTGLYTSPYLYRFAERMQINGREIPDEALVRCVGCVRDKAEKMAEHPTQFELITAAALLWFLQERCEIVVLETGLGGRFDATNAIEAPECSVIMNIGLDHTAVLGGTLEEIASEKAGIIKGGVPCVAYAQSGSVLDVIRARCEALSSPLTVPDFSAVASEFDSLEGQVFSYRGEQYALSLLGAHQRRNAAVVIETVGTLRERGWRIDQDALEHGLYAASWPGRFELCGDEPPFIVDGGHNPQCAEAVCESLLHYFPDTRRVLLLGVLRGKDAASMAAILDRAADEYVCTAPQSERALPPEELAAVLRPFGKRVSVCESVSDAVFTAKARAGRDGMVCAAGSIYLAGNVRYELGLY